MNLEDLRQDWNQANASDAAALSRDDLILRVSREAERLGGRSTFGFAVLVLAPIVVAIPDARVAFNWDVSLLEQIGAAVCVFAFAAMAGGALLHRWLHPPAPTGASLSEFCRHELRSVSTQLGMQRAFPLVCVVPLFVGMVLQKLGEQWLGGSFYVGAAATALLLTAVCVFHRYWIRTRLIPLREELLQLSESLDAENGDATLPTEPGDA